MVKTKMIKPTYSSFCYRAEVLSRNETNIRLNPLKALQKLLMTSSKNFRRFLCGRLVFPIDVTEKTLN